MIFGKVICLLYIYDVCVCVCMVRLSEKKNEFYFYEQ